MPFPYTHELPPLAPATKKLDLNQEQTVTNSQDMVNVLHALRKLSIFEFRVKYLPHGISLRFFTSTLTEVKSDNLDSVRMNKKLAAKIYICNTVLLLCQKIM